MLMNEVNWTKAKGSKVKINGRWYIDFTSSIFTQNFGHNNPYVIKEVKKQLKKCSHAYGYNTEIKEKYLEELKKFTGYKNILLFSIGAEAIEATIKIAINNGYTCVGIKGAMHGRTLGAEALVGKRELPNIETWDYIHLHKYSNKAIFIEGYRGYDCNKLDYDEEEIIKDYQLYNSGNNIVIFDEIQSGFYRTNRKFVYQCYSIKPDILVIGKSMGGGFPLSAVCWDKPFNLEGIELTSTHSGQPIQMAAGYGVLKYIQEKFNEEEYLKNRMMMDQFFNSLQTKHNNLGMVGAFECYQEDLIYRVLFNSGLLVTKTGKNWIKIAPPVNINPFDLEKGLNILRNYVK